MRCSKKGALLSKTETAVIQKTLPGESSWKMGDAPSELKMLG